MIALLTVGLGDDGRGVVLAGGKASFATGNMLGMTFPALGGAGVVTDAALDAWETRVAEALLAALPVGDRLSFMRGMTEADGGELTLAVDARSGETAALPWEALIGRAGIGHVVRVIEGGSARPHPEATRGEVRTWVVERAEPACAAVSDGLMAGLAALRCVRPADGPAGAGALRVVHLVAQGAEALRNVLLHAEDLDVAEAGLSAMAGALAEADFVFLDLCHDGVCAITDAVGLGDRVVSTGTPVCVAPTSAWPVDASGTFSTALYRSLDDGESIMEAVGAGRRALRALSSSEPTARWWTPQVFVADVGVLEDPPGLATRARPPIFPEGSAGGEAVLADAVVYAEAHGWLGVEQLAAAMLRIRSPDDLVSALRTAFGEVCRDRPPIDLAEGAPRVTLRVQDLASMLPDGWGPRQLARALATVPWVEARLDPSILARLRTRTAEELRLVTTGAPPALAPVSRGGGLVFEAVGGPEDGRRFELLRTGDSLGRFDPDAPVSAALYESGACDRAVSRRHLSWAAPDAIRVFALTWLARGGDDAVEISGTVRLRPGDRLRLGSGTWVEVV